MSEIRLSKPSFILVLIDLVNKSVFSHFTSKSDFYVQDSARYWGHEDEPKADSVCPQGIIVQRGFRGTRCSLSVNGQVSWTGRLGQRPGTERAREARASGLKEHQSCCLSWDGRKQYQINLGARYEESSVPWRLKIEAVEELERRGWKQTEQRAATYPEI